MWIGIEDIVYEFVEIFIFLDFVFFNVFYCGVFVKISLLVKIWYIWIIRIYYCLIDK